MLYFLLEIDFDKIFWHGTLAEGTQCSICFPIAAVYKKNGKFCFSHSNWAIGACSASISNEVNSPCTFVYSVNRNSAFLRQSEPASKIK